VKKRILTLCAMLLTLVFLTSCGASKPVDYSNYNFNKNGVAFFDEDNNETERKIYVSKSVNAEVYIDTTAGMQEIVSDGNFKKILLDAVDSIGKTWNDVSADIYSVGNGLEEKDISMINNLDSSMFNGGDANVVTQALEAVPNKSNEKVIVPKIKLIVTDLTNQLNNYQELSTKVRDNVMSKGQSMAFMCINTSKPFYMFAIGAEQDLSDYLTTFYEMPDVKAFNGIIDKLGMDMEHPINCIIYAQGSGLMGIDYENTVAVENGEFYTAPDAGQMPPNGQMPPMDPAMMQGGQMPPQQGMPGVPPPPPPPGPINPNEQPHNLEKSGSFTIRRNDYTAELMKKEIEGTVNFAYDEALQEVNEDDPWVEIGHPTNVSEEDVSVPDMKYLAFKSLMWSGSDEAEEYGETAGKIKIKIPFKVMSQVKLSTLLFDISTDLYTANAGDGEFYEASKKDQDCFEIAWAEGVTPSMGRYRMDDMTNTAVLNIFVPNLNDLPDYSKIDIKFSAYPEEAIIPVWVNNKSMAGYDNITKFVSLLNDYQAENNKFEEVITCYVLAGDKETHEEAETQLVSEMKK